MVRGDLGAELGESLLPALRVGGTKWARITLSSKNGLRHVDWACNI